MTGRERFVAACRGRQVDATPVWFMRQAGGRLPAYRALRKQHSVLDIAHDPALCAEVSADAATVLGTDAAVLYADIMLVAEALGLRLELTDAGPVLARPVRDASAVAALRRVDPAADLGFVLDAAGRVRAALGERAAVVGVAGGPFTVAAYLVEGRPTRDRLVARALMHAEPGLWRALLDRVADATAAYAAAQVRAGADAVQVFDSWAGVLGPDDYRRGAARWTRRVLDAITEAGGVAIHFVAASAALLDQVAERATVVAVDSGQSLSRARERLGHQPVQGNLDPARIAAGWAATSAGIDAVLDENGGRPGHLFNTGHALPPDAAPDLVRAAVDAVHERTARAAVAAYQQGAS